MAACAELEREVLSETGVQANVVTLTERPAVFKVDKKWLKASIKLVFDITAFANERSEPRRTSCRSRPSRARVRKAPGYFELSSQGSVELPVSLA